MKLTPTPKFEGACVWSSLTTDLFSFILSTKYSSESRPTVLDLMCALSLTQNVIVVCQKLRC